MKKFIEKLKNLFTMSPKEIAYAENELHHSCGLKKPGILRIELLKQISDIDIPKIDQAIETLKVEGIIIEHRDQRETYYSLSDTAKERLKPIKKDKPL